MASMVKEREVSAPGLAAPLSLRQGPQWSSFEKLRVQGPDALLGIEPGTVGTVVARSGQFRVLREDDFQHVLGLARDADRIRRGMRVILAAVRTVQQHPDPASIETLVEATLLLGDFPTLPTRAQFEALRPEETGEPVSGAEDDDEVETDPAAVRRPYAGATEE